MKSLWISVEILWLVNVLVQEIYHLIRAIQYLLLLIMLPARLIIWQVGELGKQGCIMSAHKRVGGEGSGLLKKLKIQTAVAIELVHLAHE